MSKKNPVLYDVKLTVKPTKSSKWVLMGRQYDPLFDVIGGPDGKPRLLYEYRSAEPVPPSKLESGECFGRLMVKQERKNGKLIRCICLKGL